MRYLHTMVRVSDLDQALDFYCAKLGLKEVRRVDNKPGRFTLVFLATPEDAVRVGADAYAVVAYVRGKSEAAYLRKVADAVREAIRFENELAKAA